MLIWVDAQVSPAIAAWLRTRFNVEAFAVRDLGLREAKDRAIFQAARDVSAVVMTKDDDFVQLQALLGPPPQIVWLTCGNTSNARLKDILDQTLAHALELLKSGEKLVEISGD